MSEKTPGQLAYEEFRTHLHPQLSYRWELLPADERIAFEAAVAVVRDPLLARISELESQINCLCKCDWRSGKTVICKPDCPIHGDLHD